jgi:hypothetical protein
MRETVLPRFSIGGGDPERETLRRFTDAKGLEWVVYAVVSPAAVTEGGIPSTFLCFERGVDRRRLAPIPDDWKDCGSAELCGYLERARAVHRSFASPDQFRDRTR